MTQDQRTRLENEEARLIAIYNETEGDETLEAIAAIQVAMMASEVQHWS